MEGIRFNDLEGLDRSALISSASTLFYGYVFLAGVSLLTQSTHTGTFIGLSILCSISFVSSAIGKGVEDDWSAFLDLIALISLLTAVIFGSYMAAVFSFGM